LVAMHGSMHGFSIVSKISTVGNRQPLCIAPRMPRKIITVDKEANLGLVRAKRDRRESLSALIKRARWRAGKKRCGDLLGRVGRSEGGSQS